MSASVLNALSPVTTVSETKAGLGQSVVAQSVPESTFDSSFLEQIKSLQAKGDLQEGGALEKIAGLIEGQGQSFSALLGDKLPQIKQNIKAQDINLDETMAALKDVLANLDALKKPSQLPVGLSHDSPSEMRPVKLQSSSEGQLATEIGLEEPQLAPERKLSTEIELEELQLTSERELPTEIGLEELQLIPERELPTEIGLEELQLTSERELPTEIGLEELQLIPERKLPTEIGLEELQLIPERKLSTEIGLEELQLIPESKLSTEIELEGLQPIPESKLSAEIGLEELQITPKSQLPAEIGLEESLFTPESRLSSEIPLETDDILNEKINLTNEPVSISVDKSFVELAEVNKRSQGLREGEQATEAINYVKASISNTQNTDNGAEHSSSGQISTNESLEGLVNNQSVTAPEIANKVHKPSISNVDKVTHVDEEQLEQELILEVQAQAGSIVAEQAQVRNSNNEDHSLQANTQINAPQFMKQEKMNAQEKPYMSSEQVLPADENVETEVDLGQLLKREKLINSKEDVLSLVSSKRPEKAVDLPVSSLHFNTEQASNKFATADLMTLNRQVENTNFAKQELPPMTKPFNHPEWRQEFNERVVWMHTKSIPVAELRLNPQNLGPISIQVSIDKDQQASILFNAQNAGVREAIEASIPKLREMLNAQQINLSEVNVSQQQQQGQGSARQAMQDAMAENNRNNSRNPIDSNANEPDLDVNNITEEINQGRAVASKGILSIYA